MPLRIVAVLAQTSPSIRIKSSTNTIAGVATPATLGNIAIGMNTSVYYNNIDKSYMSPALDNAGVSIVRYPGGNFSDIYHWTNNVATGGYSATSSNFGSFAKSILNGPSGLAKQAMVTVNYGASLNDTMGGQPQEAAAWVAYANGTIDGANATMQLGTDGEGHNWGTVRYWAALRAANPANANWATDGSTGVVLGASDMPNITAGTFSEAQSRRALGRSELGNRQRTERQRLLRHRAELAARPAFHRHWSLSPGTTKPVAHILRSTVDQLRESDESRRSHDQNRRRPEQRRELRPARAASLGCRPRYSANSVCGQFHGLRHCPLLSKLRRQQRYAGAEFSCRAPGDIPSAINGERSNYLKNYPATGVDASHIPIYITEFGNLGNTLPTVDEGLQTVIDYAAFLQSGVTSVEMWEMATKSFLDDTASLSPSTRGSYYSMQALHDFIRPGDTFISSSTSQTSTGIVYAAKRPDGTIALMLVNPNTVAQNMPVTINGNALKDGGIQYLTSLTANPVQSAVTGLGNHFTASLAGRSMAVLLLTPRLSGDFNDDGIVDAADYTVWRDTLGQTGQDLAADFTGPSGTPDGVVD